MIKVRKLAHKILPPGSRQRRAAVRVKRAVNSLLSIDDSLTYGEWIKKVEPKTHSAPVVNGPEIALIIPVYNTPRKYLKPLLMSIKKQTYQNWKLYIVDGSSDPKKAKIVESFCQFEDRIVYKRLEKNLGISGNTNEGLKLINSTYVGFVDHDDTLPVWALQEVARVINHDNNVDLIYSDEDKLSNRGSWRSNPLFKPDWSPELFLGVNYMAHFVVVRTALIKKVGMLRPEYDGAQDYDLLLRLIELKPKIKHIPQILYHWRAAIGSTARAIGEKSYADAAGRKALEDHIARTKKKAEVVPIKDRPTNYRLRYRLIGGPQVSIIIPFKDKAQLLKTCVTSIIEKSTYENYEIILVSNNSKELKTLNYLSSIKSNKRIKQYIYDKPFNYSEVNNFGRSKAHGEVLVFLNNDTKVITPTWIEELAATAQQPHFGAIGPMLLYPDKTIQHAGVVLGMTGLAGHVFRNLKPGTTTPFGLPDWPRDYLAITGACLVIETKKFDEVGGFDEKFIMCGSDVTLGLSLYKKGYRNIYWPYARLIHFESKSVGSYLNAPPSDYEYSLREYHPFLNYHDPYFNRNLAMRSEIPEMRDN